MSKRNLNAEGTYLAHARKPDCGNCGREMVKAHRIHLGTGYCSICYPRIFPPRDCHVCGKIARAHRNDENPICGECLREDRCCLRCGKLTPKAALRVGQRVACQACAHYYRPPVQCDMCSNLSTRLSRSSAFPDNGRMCDKCLRKTVGATCGHCGKHRTVNFMTLDKKALCKTCCISPNASHPCPDCGSMVNGPGVNACMSCSIKRSNVRRQLDTQHMFTSLRVQEIYAEFTQWCNNSGRASKLAAGAGRYLQFLAKLDIALQQEPGPVNQDLILHVFSTEEVRQMGLLSQHLAELGLINDDAFARQRRSDERLLVVMLEEISSQRWAAEIKAFAVDLSERKPPLALRTRKSYLQAAISLLTHAGVARASHISQKALNAFIIKKPGQKASVSAFLAHLGSVHGTMLKIQSMAPKPAPPIRQAKYVRRLLDAIDAAPPRPRRLANTAALLSKLLKVPMERILRLRHSDLDLLTFKRVRLEGKWVELPDRMQPILQELPSEQWRAGLDTDPYLFAGRQLMDQLSVAAVRYHVNLSLNESGPRK